MASFIGTLIKRERLKRNYSQEGLCRGICVVSYLSKIEQGKAEAGADIIRALLNRLGISYEIDQNFLKEAGKKIELLYEKLQEGILKQEDFVEIEKEYQRYLASEYMLDVMLFQKYFAGNETNEKIEQSEQESRKEGISPGTSAQKAEELEEYLMCMSQRQYELYLYCTYEEHPHHLELLMKLNPNGYYLNAAGVFYWRKGEGVKAVEILNRAYQVSCEEGTVENMLLAQIMLGNCYSSMEQKELMMKHYMTAKRLARALQKTEDLSTISYNIASTLLEWNQVEEALEYFEECSRKDILYYHKYAICMERLGEKEKAKKMLQKGREAEDSDTCPIYQEMCEVVAYRLEHEDYLNQPAYEKMLRSCMKHMREQLPRGYEQFHAPYLMEVLEHQRKYKEICSLLKEFPAK